MFCTKSQIYKVNSFFRTSSCVREEVGHPRARDLRRLRLPGDRAEQPAERVRLPEGLRPGPAVQLQADQDEAVGVD